MFKQFSIPSFEKCKAIFFSDTMFHLFTGMLGAVIVLFLSHLVDPYPKPRIATVDITGIVNQFIQSEAKQNLPQAQLQIRVSQFGNDLQTVLNNIAEKQHVVLLPQQAVIAGSPDLTPLVMQKMQKLQQMQSAESAR